MLAGTAVPEVSAFSASHTMVACTIPPGDVSQQVPCFSALVPLQGQASLEPLLPNAKGMPIKVIGGTQALGRHGEVLNLVESHEVIVKVGGSELKVLPRPFVAVLCLPSA